MNVAAPTWAVRVHWARVQARDAVELFVLPGLAVLLPWPLCFALYKRLARLPWLYRQTANNALKQAQQRGWVSDPQQWLMRRKLVTLVDHADFGLTWARSRRWLARYMHTQGQWPQPHAPAVLCTFHWGAGMWSLRHARNAGMDAHILVAPLNGEHFAGRPVLHAYAKARTRALTRELGHETLNASVPLRPVLKALRRNEQIMAVIDVPADAVSASSDVELLGMHARVPRGLLRLATDHAIPVTVFTVGINLETGHRKLILETLPVERDTETLIARVFSKLDDALRWQPEAWHFWSEADRFFVSPGSE